MNTQQLERRVKRLEENFSRLNESNSNFINVTFHDWQLNVNRYLLGPLFEFWSVDEEDPRIEGIFEYINDYVLEKCVVYRKGYNFEFDMIIDVKKFVVLMSKYAKNRDLIGKEFLNKIPNFYFPEEIIVTTKNRDGRKSLFKRLKQIVSLSKISRDLKRLNVPFKFEGVDSRYSGFIAKTSADETGYGKIVNLTKMSDFDKHYAKGSPRLQPKYQFELKFLKFLTTDEIELNASIVFLVDDNGKSQQKVIEKKSKKFNLRKFSEEEILEEAEKFLDLVYFSLYKEYKY